MVCLMVKSDCSSLGYTRFKVNHCECVWQFLWLRKTHKSLWPAWKFNHIQLVFHLILVIHHCSCLFCPKNPFNIIVVTILSESFRFLFCGCECHVVGNGWFQTAVYRNCLWIRSFLFGNLWMLGSGEKNLFRGKSESYSWARSLPISCMVIQMGSLPKIQDLWLCKTEQKNDVFSPSI